MPDQDEEKKEDGTIEIKVGYLVDNGLNGSRFDSQYITYSESRPGATDLNNVRLEVVAAFNGLAKQACKNGGKLCITGAAETINPDTGKHYHATGPYGHEGGWKLDVDPASIYNSCGLDAFLELCQQYYCAVGDETATGNHYDLAFHASGGTGGERISTPPKYLSEIYGDTEGGNNNPNVKPNTTPKKTKAGIAQYEGFDIQPVGKDTVKVTKLPKGLTECEPVYPDLIMISDFLPKWALDAAAEVTNVGDDSMIQWGKSTNKTPSSSGNDNTSGGTGNDSTSGGAGNDSTSGGSGSDTTAGGSGDNTVPGGSGNDSGSGSGNDSTSGGSGGGSSSDDSGGSNPGSGNNDSPSGGSGGGNDSTPGGSGTPSLPGGEIPHTIYFPEDNRPKNLNGLNLDDMIIWG